MRGPVAFPTVAVKLSGLGTFEHACSVALWRPVIEETLMLFGPERALWGSNFPVERLWTTYGHLIDVVQAFLSSLNSSERRL